jgi:hypothetical protein
VHLLRKEVIIGAEGKCVVKLTKLEYMVVASGDEKDMVAFAAALSAILKDPPSGVDVDPVATKFRFLDVAAARTH